MYIYVINVLLILMSMFLLNYSKKKEYVNIFSYEIATENIEKNLIAFSVFQLFLTTVLKRYDVGSDVLVYKDGFESIATLSWGELFTFDWEIGYVLINKVISIFTNNFFFLILLMYIVIYLLLVRFVLAESSNKLLSIYLFVVMGFFTFTFSSYRQSIALMLTTLSTKYVKERKFYPFFLTVILATLFHNSAIVFVIVYFLQNIEIDKNYAKVLFFSSLMLFIFGGSIANFLVSLYNPNYQIIAGEGYKLFAVYIFIVISAMTVYLYNKEKHYQSNNVKLFLHLMTIATILQIVSFNLSIFVRVVTYFSFSLVILIPNVIMSINNVKYRRIAFVITIIFTFLFFLIYLKGNPYDTVPYSFFWNK